MSDLLPTIIPPEDINNDREAEVSETTDAFEGDEEIINEELKETIAEEDEEVPDKPSVPPEEVFKGDDTEGVVEEEAPKKKPKRKITEAQREHLARARKKANEVRKRKAQERKLLKQQERRQIDKAKKEVAEKIKNKNKEPVAVLHNPMESEEEEEAVPPPAPVPQKVSFSMEDIDEDLLVKLSEMAVEKYDTKRKKRKEEKQKKIKEVKAETETHQQILNAVNPPMNDVWDSCFQ
jgi:hypothetical protein